MGNSIDPGTSKTSSLFSHQDSKIYQQIERGRRRSVAADSFDLKKDDDDELFVVFPKAISQRARLLNAMKDIFLFKNLEEDQFHRIKDAMREEPVSAKTNVIFQGDNEDHFYVIEKREFVIIAYFQKVGSYSNTGFFGELPLMYNTRRAATIKTTTDAILGVMDRSIFRRIVSIVTYPLILKPICVNRVVFVLMQVVTPFDTGCVLVSTSHIAMFETSVVVGNCGMEEPSNDAWIQHSFLNTLEPKALRVIVMHEVVPALGSCCFSIRVSAQTNHQIASYDPTKGGINVLNYSDSFRSRVSVAKIIICLIALAFGLNLTITREYCSTQLTGIQMSIVPQRDTMLPYAQIGVSSCNPSGYWFTVSINRRYGPSRYIKWFAVIPNRQFNLWLPVSPNRGTRQPLAILVVGSVGTTTRTVVLFFCSAFTVHKRSQQVSQLQQKFPLWVKIVQKDGRSYARNI